MKILSFGSLNYDYTYEVEHFLAPKETQMCIRDRVDILGSRLKDAKFSLPEAVNLLADLKIKLS